MRNVRVALAQIAPRLGEIDANLTVHLESVREARRAGADLVVFPELSLTGYLLRDQVPEVALRADAPRLRSLVRASRNLDIMLGFVEETPDHRYHNATAYLSRGRLVHVHHKVYLPTYGMFEEGRDFAAGDRIRAFDAPFGRAGMLICEDCWHPACAWILAQQGLDVLLAASNGPTRGARPGKGITSVTVWHDLLRVTAQLQTAFVVYVNRIGYEDGLNFGGGSMAVDPFGRALATLPALTPALDVVELDAGVLRRARIAYPLLRDENLDLAAREIDRIRRLRYDLPAAAEEATGPARP
jgi:predicted amidohydrolase